MPAIIPDPYCNRTPLSALRLLPIGENRSNADRTMTMLVNSLGRFLMVLISAEIEKARMIMACHAILRRHQRRLRSHRANTNPFHQTTLSTFHGRVHGLVGVGPVFACPLR